MPDWRRIFGNSAETKAAQYLQKKGYTILERQYNTVFGEIDLIAQDGDEIVFVEVKARRTAAFGYPEEAVTKKKRQKIYRTAQQYLQKHGRVHASYRCDVIAILGEEIHHIIGIE